MMNSTEKRRTLQDFTHEMKRDWDDRARQNAKWFINTIKFAQSDEEFYGSGKPEVERLILSDMALLTQGRDPKTLRILEIGCGLGRMTCHLTGLFGEVHSTDVSGEMVRQARERLQQHANAHFYETSGVDFTEFPNDHFDIVFSVYVFQHVPSAEVIRSNITDAYRVLKPGGVMKFQTNSITALAYEEVEKDTWAGATYSEADIRRTARELGAHLISIFGADTQYCWTTLRKRQLPTSSVAQAAITRPQIELYGRADDLQIKQIPTSGDYAYLTLLVSGLVREEVDANNLTVEINGRKALPTYVGAVGENFATALQVESGTPPDHLTQINLRIPSGEPGGKANVRVRLSSDEASPPVMIDLLEPQPVVPKINLVRNEGDGGVDIYARGPKSALVIYVEGLDESADTGNVRVKVGQHILKPRYVGFVPGNGVYQINAQLPADIAPGEVALSVYFGNLESPAKPLDIKWADEFIR